MTETTPHTEAVDRLERSFSRLMVQFRRVQEQMATAVSPGMLPGTYKVLSVIHRHESTTISELASIIGVDKGQISRYVTELESLDLVERLADPNDGRVKRISLTAEGNERLSSASGPFRTMLDETLSTWPIETIDEFTGLLSALATGQAPGEAPLDADE